MSARLEFDAQRCSGRYPDLEMRRENHRGAPREVLSDQILNTLHCRGIERRERLIQDPKRNRFAQGQASERRSAALPLRQHARGQVLASGKAEPAERLADLRRLHRDTGERARHVQILGGSQVILDCIGVSDVDELPPEFLLKPPDIVAAPTHFAAGRFEKATCDAQEARLAGTVGSSDPQQIAAAQREVQGAEELALAAHAVKISRLERGGARFFSHRSDLGGGELRPDLREQALGIAAAHASDVVLVLQKSTEGVVDGLRIQRHLVERHQRLRPVDRLGDAGEFEQIHLAQALHESHHLARKVFGGLRGLSLEDFELPRGVRIIHPVVETAPLDGVVDLARAVGSEHDDRRFSGSHRADLGNRDLEVRQYFQQIRLERLVGAVQFVDQQHRRRALCAFERLHQRPLDEEALGENVLRDRVARRSLRFGQSYLDHLARIVPLVYGGSDVEALVALQAHERAAETVGEDLCDFGLAHPGLAFEKQWTAHLEREEYGRCEAALGHVIGACEQGEGVVDRLRKRAHPRIMPAWPAKDFPREGKLIQGSAKGLGGDRAPGSTAAYEQRVLRQYAEAARGDDAVFPRVGLVVAFDVVEAVNVVHHEPRRAAHARGGDVAEPVEALEARAVAEVEPRHRVERLVVLFGVQKIVGAQAGELFQDFRGTRLVLEPVLHVDLGEQGSELRVPGIAFPQPCSVGEPFAETRDRRERGEGLQARKLAAEVYGDLLDEKIAERDAAQAFLGIRDRIKDRAVGRSGIHYRGVEGEQRLHLGAHASGERHLDEDHRLVGQRRMEKRVAAPVGLEPAAQVVPALDLVHGFVLDQLLQHESGGTPVDALQDQESAIEPGTEQIGEVGLDARPMRMLGQAPQQPAPHLQEHADSSGRHVEAPEEFLARRFHGPLQAHEIAGGRLLAVGLGGPADRLRVEGKLLDEDREKNLQRRLIQRLIGGKRLARDERAGHLAALGPEFVANRRYAAGTAHGSARRHSRAGRRGPEQTLQEERFVHASLWTTRTAPGSGHARTNYASLS